MTAELKSRYHPDFKWKRVLIQTWSVQLDGHARIVATLCRGPRPDRTIGESSWFLTDRSKKHSVFATAKLTIPVYSMTKPTGNSRFSFFVFLFWSTTIRLLVVIEWERAPWFPVLQSRFRYRRNGWLGVSINPTEPTPFSIWFTFVPLVNLAVLDDWARLLTFRSITTPLKPSSGRLVWWSANWVISYRKKKKNAWPILQLGLICDYTSFTTHSKTRKINMKRGPSVPDRYISRPGVVKWNKTTTAQKKCVRLKDIGLYKQSVQQYNTGRKKK